MLGKIFWVTLLIVAVSLVITLWVPSTTEIRVEDFPIEDPVDQEVVARNSVRGFVEREAFAAGVNPELALCIVEHESQFRPWVDGLDTGSTTSRGLWQINDYWHPEVSDIFAHDMASSTEWSLKEIKNGNVGWWGTYWQYCSSIKVLL